MRLSFLLFTLFLLNACSSKEHEQIQVFETTLGKNKAKALDKLVFDFEKNLAKNYPNKELKEAYKQYLIDIQHTTSRDTLIFDFQSKTTQSSLHKSGLWDELYQHDTLIDANTNEVFTTIEVNTTGKYLIALYEVKHSDSLISKYYNIRETAELMHTDFFIDGFLSMDPDFDNYFHKRIAVIEFSY